MDKRTASIKGALAVIAAASLGGCAIVPAEPMPVYAGPPPAVYAVPAPPPVVVVRPYGYYGYYRGGRYWRRWR
jgi:hypothetical protein